MFNKSQVSWNKNTYWRDLTEESVSHTITKDDPQLLFNWESMTNMRNIGLEVEKYLHFKLQNITYDASTQIHSNNSITDHEWDLSLKEPSRLFRIESESHFCPNITGSELTGNYLNTMGTKYISMKFGRWHSKFQGESGCINDTFFDNFTDYSALHVHMKNNYIDLNDIDNPIKCKLILKDIKDDNFF